MAALVLLAWVVPARGQQPSGASGGLYELSRVHRAAAARGLQPTTPRPGARIAFIDVAREDVFTADEVYPTWPNALHWLTDEVVIRRELLVDVGEPYDDKLVQESMRNLRALGVFSLVHILPVRGPEPGTVGLLVYTRDLWSLRLESSFAGTGEAFQATIQVTERNLFGRDKQGTVRFDIDPKAFSLGEVYYDPRFTGRKLALTETFDVIWNRDSGETEGSQGYLSFGSPFYNLGEHWAWGMSGSYAVYVSRDLVGAEVVSFREGQGGGIVACRTPAPDCVRSVWDSRSYAASTSLTYRRGERYRQSFGLRFGISDLDVQANAETALRPGQEALFERELLPRERRQVAPSVTYGLSLPDYAVYENLATFGQSETVRKGPSASASLSFPLRAFGSSSDSVLFSYGAGYVLALDRALAEVQTSAGARLEDGAVLDQNASVLLRGATPPLWVGRLVGRASWSGRKRDSTQSQVTLGSSNGLRGYDNGAFRVVGGSRILANVEYRTLPWELSSIHVGGVLFYDVGSVYEDLGELDLHHGAGVGLRFLFPQFNRSVFRLDLGAPLDQSGFTVLLAYGSSQLVPVTANEVTAGGGVRPR
jgi:hypothetical protein